MLKELGTFLQDNFDKIYCLNLDKRPDRRQEMLILFKEIWIDQIVKRFSAIENIKWNVWCALSHAAILKEAKKEWYKSIFVFEDDVEIKDIKSLLNSIKTYPKNIERDILLFWYSLLYINWYNEKIINDNWKAWYWLTGTMAIWYSFKTFDRIINFIWEDTNNLTNKMDVRTWFDRWLALILQRNYTTLFTSKNLIYEWYTLSNVTWNLANIYPRMLKKQKNYKTIFQYKLLRFLYQKAYLNLLPIYWYLKWRK